MQGDSVVVGRKNLYAKGRGVSVVSAWEVRNYRGYAGEHACSMSVTARARSDARAPITLIITDGGVSLIAVGLPLSTSFSDMGALAALSLGLSRMVTALMRP